MCHLGEGWHHLYTGIQILNLPTSFAKPRTHPDPAVVSTGGGLRGLWRKPSQVTENNNSKDKAAKQSLHL